MRWMSFCHCSRYQVGFATSWSQCLASRNNRSCLPGKTSSFSKLDTDSQMDDCPNSLVTSRDTSPFAISGKRRWGSRQPTFWNEFSRLCMELVILGAHRSRNAYSEWEGFTTFIRSILPNFIFLILHAFGPARLTKQVDVRTSFEAR